MEHVQEKVSRRSVLRYGLGGLVAVGGGTSLVVLPAQRASADLVEARLYVVGGERTMIDGLVVPFRGFGSTRDRLELPSGQLEVQVGDTVVVDLTNTSTSPVGFTVAPSPGYGGFVGNLVMGVLFVCLYRRWGRVGPLVVAHALLDIGAFVGYALLAGRVDWLPTA